MIVVKNLHKSFGDAHILKGISTTFDAGKTNLIIGQSGSGKTIFLKCLLGLFDYESGTISYDGKIFSQLSEDEKRDINTWYELTDKKARYKGEWKNGLPNGKGIKHCYKTDSYLEGNFVDGLLKQASTNLGIPKKYEGVAKDYIKSEIEKQIKAQFNK